MGEEEVLERFRVKMEDWRHKGVILSDGSEGFPECVPYFDMSRYSPEGRGRIAGKLLEGLKDESRPGALVTLTYNSLLSKSEAWRVCSRDSRIFLNRLKQYCRDQGKKNFEHLFMVEPQTKYGRNYPHVHVWVPGVVWVLHKDRIAKMWGRGFVDVRYRENAKAYIIKYLLKAKWPEECLAFLWWGRARLYGASRSLFTKAVKAKSGWVFIARWSGDRAWVPVWDGRFWRGIETHLGSALMGFEDFGFT